MNYLVNQDISEEVDDSLSQCYSIYKSSCKENETTKTIIFNKNLL